VSIAQHEWDSNRRESCARDQVHSRHAGHGAVTHPLLLSSNFIALRSASE